LAKSNDTKDELVCKFLGVDDFSRVSNSPLLQQLADIIGQIKHSIIPECRVGSEEDHNMEPRFKFGSVSLPFIAAPGSAAPGSVEAEAVGGGGYPSRPRGGSRTGLHVRGPGSVDGDDKKDDDDFNDPAAASVSALSRGGRRKRSGRSPVLLEIREQTRKGLAAELLTDRLANSILDITIVSANVTGWSSAKSFLEKQTADIILLQEIKRQGADADQAKPNSHDWAITVVWPKVLLQRKMDLAQVLQFCVRDGYMY